MNTETTDTNCIVGQAYTRDPVTGLIAGKVYPIRPDGRIDWVKLIPHDQIVFNTSPKLSEEILKTYGKSASMLKYSELMAEGIEVNPKHVLVLLAGFMELLSIRGGSVTGRIAHALSYPPEAAISICECHIDWIPNREDPAGFRSFGAADATMENTGGWGYLTAMAENRALVRAIKKGLRIPILGFDEIAKKDSAIPESASSTAASSGPAISQTSPSGALQKHALESNPPISFDVLKKGASTKYRQRIEGDPEVWSAWTDISPRDCWTLITIIKEGEEEKKSSKAKK